MKTTTMMICMEQITTLIYMLKNLMQPLMTSPLLTGLCTSVVAISLTMILANLLKSVY